MQQQIPTDGVKPLWFYYDNLLLGDLVTEEVGENFRVSSYENFLRVYQDIVIRESIIFTNLLDKLVEVEETLSLITGLVKLISLLSDKTKIPPNIDLICIEMEKQISKRVNGLKQQISKVSSKEESKNILDKLHNFKEQVCVYDSTCDCKKFSNLRSTIDKLILNLATTLKSSHRDP
jgi:hypothetical protein